MEFAHKENEFKVMEEAAFQEHVTIDREKIPPMAFVFLVVIIREPRMTTLLVDQINVLPTKFR